MDARATLLRPMRRLCSRLLRSLPVSSRTLGPPKGIDTTANWIEFRKSVGIQSAIQSWRVSEGAIVERRPPSTIEPEIFEGFRCLFRESPLDLPSWGHPKREFHPPGKVFRIEGARLLNFCVLSPDDYILMDLSLHHFAKPEDFDWLLSAVKFPKPLRLRGDLTVLGEVYASSYYHWLFFGLGRLCYVKKRFSLDTISHFGVSHLDQAFARESLRLMEIPEEKIIALIDFPHLEPDAIVVSSWTGSFDPTIAHLLRETFLPHAKQDRETKRIYVSRSRTTRHIHNEEELLGEIEPLGFEKVYCEDLGFLEQISLFHNADVVLSPHGAGLSNLVFCKPGTKVIEIFNRGWLAPVFWQISEAVGLDHYCLFGEDAPSADPRLASQHKNIQFSIGDLRKLLKIAGLSKS